MPVEMIGDMPCLSYKITDARYGVHQWQDTFYKNLAILFANPHLHHGKRICKIIRLFETEYRLLLNLIGETYAEHWRWPQALRLVRGLQGLTVKLHLLPNQVLGAVGLSDYSISYDKILMARIPSRMSAAELAFVTRPSKALQQLRKAA